MKTIFYFLFLISIGQVTAQNIAGSWNGVLKVQGTELKLVLNVKSENNQLSANMDSPSQGAKGIPVSSISYKDSILNFAIDNIGAQYSGRLNKEGFFSGIFKQSGLSLPLDLKKGSDEVRHPQTPVPPYPYVSEDIQFDNKEAGNRLAGTLTYPEKGSKFPAVILISGSGAQNRDEELFGHKPFLVLADHLTRNGVAVLRFDDRGYGESTGNFATATTKDFATDVKAGIEYLKTRNMVDPKKIGLIGHSEGGLIAPMIASDSKQVTFVVMLAGPGLPGDQILLMQSAISARASGASEEVLSSIKNIYSPAYLIAKKPTDTQTCQQELTTYFNEAYSNAGQFSNDGQKKAYINQQITVMTSPWMRYFLSYDPVPTLQKVKCPVLALFGEKDTQVPPKENAVAVKKALQNGENKNFEVKELPGLNHLFQECTTGLTTEYATIEQTFSPTALKVISDWISNQTK